MHPFPDPRPGVPDHRSPARYLWWLVGVRRGAAVLAVLYGILCALCQGLVPAAVGKGIDAGLIARNQGELLIWSGAILALGVGQAVTGTLRDRCSVRNRYGASYATTQFITRQAAALGATLPKRVSAGEAMSVGSADVTRVGVALESSARGSGAVVSALVVAGIMLYQSWQLGLLVLLGIPAITWAMARLMRLLHRRQDELRAQQSVLTDLAVDIVAGLRVLRGIGGEEVFADRYRTTSQRVRQESVRVAAVEAWITGAKLLLPGLLVTAVIWLGAHYVDTGRISAGLLVSFYGYGVFLAEQLRRATGMVDQLTRAMVAAKRVVALLDLTPELGSGTEASDPAAKADLEDPESGLTLPAGRFVGVVCATPADAAVLADRLGRYTDSAATYAGVPLSALPLAEVRRRILVADNEARLFSGPLRGELDPYGRAATDPRLLPRALDDASAADIVEPLPEGLDTVIGNAGREFSGGQQQRLRLARALMADPEVLILVEPTNAVDAHTEGRIAARLAAHRAGRSTLVLTASPILLDHTEQVLLVLDGKVVAGGTHAELLADPRYRSTVTREVAAP
ncbi:ABC transporter ATP-binding protein [Kitasatospora sp. MAP5-34]|uniref:ABC transporter ATP-binding protein n=1 Tax=Kitasatospora sp. MAP5-34 TaxID=3035102 RepID=UPI002474F3B6|nr:ABC transporter ATP-binding protein [Kitasatospora sp. MAP5-34]MDH6578569.1 ABC-type multidrug transport system fused ATPase/permease subunit [Kitasatospora sp. MAP5-34]